MRVSIEIDSKIIMPKSKKNRVNKKVAGAAAVANTLSIELVMENIKDASDLKDKLAAGQWIIKPKCKTHKVYYRYVIMHDGSLEKQSVTNSCTSGNKAKGDRARDLIRRDYTADGGVRKVINSSYVKANPDKFHP